MSKRLPPDAYREIMEKVEQKRIDDLRFQNIRELTKRTTRVYTCFHCLNFYWNEEEVIVTRRPEGRIIDVSCPTCHTLGMRQLEDQIRSLPDGP